MTEATIPAGGGQEQALVSAHPAVEVTLSREELRAAVVRQGVERVRVRREVVTEQIDVTVTVRREVLRVERVEIAPGAHAPADSSGPLTAGGGGVWEMVLHQEQPVVGVQVVPIERVRVQVTAAGGLQEVAADLTVEHVEVTEAASPARVQPG